jgi:hypothetical protein
MAEWLPLCHDRSRFLLARSLFPHATVFDVLGRGIMYLWANGRSCTELAQVRGAYASKTTKISDGASQ